MDWNSDLASIIIKFPDTIATPVAVIFGISSKLVEGDQVGLTSSPPEGEEEESGSSDEEEDAKKGKKKFDFGLKVRRILFIFGRPFFCIRRVAIFLDLCYPFDHETTRYFSPL